jgi:uncharacterized protein YdhG (YjbR/CyaY superfamily)
MSIVDDYLMVLDGVERQIITHMYALVRQLVPDATEGVSYAMPTFKYQGKDLVAIMANKQFMSLYPFGSVKRLGVDLGDFECTSGSIHFTAEAPISDELLQQIIVARLKQIAA